MRPRHHQHATTTHLLGHVSTLLGALVLHWLVLMASTLPTNAAPCTAEDFAAAVDRAGAALREFNAKHAPQLTASLKTLQKKRGWSDSEFEDKAAAFLHDDKVVALDRKTNELLARIDTLGEIERGAAPDCKRLKDLEQAGRDLLSTMQAKSELTQTKIAAAMGAAETTDAGPKPGVPEPSQAEKPAPPRIPERINQAVEEPPAKPVKPAEQSKPVEQAKPVERPRKQEAIAAAPSPARTGEWNTATRPPNDSYTPPSPPVPQNDAYRPPPATHAQDLTADGGEAGYTIDEIKAASRGFFGTISTNLASVIEYAFSNFGRPTGYVLGSEGGGAFLAGARYGKGDLYMRSGERRKVYWHGPSVGYDVGAEGSRTLFLIYKLQDADELFRAYAGVDGSAYVLGGVGLTVLKGGPVLMAPIRTGVGLRLGANIGYLRFTTQSTWNPF